MKNKEKSVTIL